MHQLFTRNSKISGTAKELSARLYLRIDKIHIYFKRNNLSVLMPLTIFMRKAQHTSAHLSQWYLHTPRLSLEFISNFGCQKNTWEARNAKRLNIPHQTNFRVQQHLSEISLMASLNAGFMSTEHLSEVGLSAHIPVTSLFRFSKATSLARQPYIFIL
jgi:hypothetical protein